MTDIKRVLVVDDDASITNLLSEYLSTIVGHELYVALTGEEALKILEAKKPNAVLLDMQLPGIKGTQILEIIRQKYPSTKVLVITSYDTQVKDIVARLGVDGFFPKPPVFNEIVTRLKEVLEAKEQEDTTITPVTLDEVRKREDVMPKAKIMFIERDYWMPYLLPIYDIENPQDLPIERYGQYDYYPVYCQEDVLPELKKRKPDIVICATYVPKELRWGAADVSTADLLLKIMKSKYAPKAIIVHGIQQDINSFGVSSLTGDSGTWVEKDNMYDFDEYQQGEKKEKAERLNKMIWRICFKYGLVEKAK